MLVRIFNARMPTIAEDIVPNARGAMLVICFILMLSSKNAPVMAGIESRKEKLKASLLSRPHASPQEMVAPDLDIPGIIAIPWAVPIMRELRMPTFLLCFSGINFVIARNMPVIQSIMPAVRGEEKALSKKSMNINPIIAVGTEPIIMLIASKKSGSSLLSRINEEVIFFISLKKYMRTADSVPICTAQSNNNSGSLNPSNVWKITRCPELLTGKNSVSPCIMPRIIA